MNFMKTLSVLGMVLALCLGKPALAQQRPSGLPVEPVRLTVGGFAWVAAPDTRGGEPDWEGPWTIRRIGQFQKIEGADAILVDGFQKRWMVPSGFTLPSQRATGLAPGACVLVSKLGNAAYYGRVVAATAGRIQVSSVSYTSTTEYATPEEVLSLDGSLSFGAPVAYRNGSSWTPGQLVHRGPKTSWLLGFGGVLTQLPTTSLKAVTLTPFRAGDRVLAHSVGDFVPAVVTEVLNNGAGYRVKMKAFNGDGDEFKDLSYSEVTAPR